MFPSSFRLNLRQESDFFASAHSINGQFLRVLFDQSPPSPSPDRLRLAVIVPKRHGQAVQRNQTKRFIRAATMAIKQEFPAVFDLPYAVVVFVKGKPQTYATYEQELRHLLTQLHQRHQRHQRHLQHDH